MRTLLSFTSQLGIPSAGHHKESTEEPIPGQTSTSATNELFYYRMNGNFLHSYLENISKMLHKYSTNLSVLPATYLMWLVLTLGSPVKLSQMQGAGGAV